MKPVTSFLTVLVLLAGIIYPADSIPDGRQRPEITSLAFGSCNHSHLPQPLWSVIASHNPDLFLWTGDVVYSDTTDVAVMHAKYQQQLQHPGYKSFRQKIPIIGIWDDHDYGSDNADRTNPIKTQAQQMFLDFVAEPMDSTRRTQSGIYTSYVYGRGANSVKVILLDTRFHKEKPGLLSAELLGREQWRWLETELKQSTSRVNLIVSGFSVLSQSIPYAEEWMDHQSARKKLFDLIEKHRVSGVIFLTGDRHFSAHLKSRENGHLYHEFMSSGLTHYLRRKNVTRFLRYYYGAGNTYFGRNFSLIRFDWSEPAPQFSFSVYDVNNNTRMHRQFRLTGRHWRQLLATTTDK